MNCVIIDDDVLCQRVVADFINKTNGLILKAIYNGPTEALNTDENFGDIDLLFLDIEMPDMTGIELLQTKSLHPMAIIMSARERYALEAFELDVVDYLLKPLSYARFIRAISKAKVLQELKKSKSPTPAPESIAEHLVVKSGQQIIRLKIEDLLWIEAIENYVKIVTITEKHIIHTSLKSIEEKLVNTSMIKVHRSFLVNARNIKLLENNTIVFQLKGETTYIPIARAHKQDLDRWLT